MSPDRRDKYLTMPVTPSRRKRVVFAKASGGTPSTAGVGTLNTLVEITASSDDEEEDAIVRSGKPRSARLPFVVIDKSEVGHVSSKEAAISLKKVKTSQLSTQDKENDTTNTSDSEPMFVNLIIGPQKVRFRVDCAKLHKSSEFFKRLLDQPDLNANQNHFIVLPTFDAALFGKFAEFLENGSLDNASTPLSNSDVARLWHFAQEIEAQEVADRCIVTLFVRLVGNHTILFPNSRTADEVEKTKNLLEVAYSGGELTRLANLVTDYTIQAIMHGHGREVMSWLGDMPVAMTKVLLKRQIQATAFALTRNQPPKAPTFNLVRYLSRNEERVQH